MKPRTRKPGLAKVKIGGKQVYLYCKHPNGSNVREDVVRQIETIINEWKTLSQRLGEVDRDVENLQDDLRQLSESNKKKQEIIDGLILSNNEMHIESMNEQIDTLDIIDHYEKSRRYSLIVVFAATLLFVSVFSGFGRALIASIVVSITFAAFQTAFSIYANRKVDEHQE
jgi:hypothetical protein